MKGRSTVSKIYRMGNDKMIASNPRALKCYIQTWVKEKHNERHNSIHSNIFSNLGKNEMCAQCLNMWPSKPNHSCKVKIIK